MVVQAALLDNGPCGDRAAGRMVKSSL